MVAFNVPAIWRKNKAKKPEAGVTTNALALHFSAPAERRAPPLLPPALPEAPAQRPKAVVAFDTTASREKAVAMSAALTDAVLAALPGQLDVALAAHGGGRVHTFTPFTSDAGTLRDRATQLRCAAGYTRLLDILARVPKTDGVKVVIYIGDAFEESERRARKLASEFEAHGIRLIFLLDVAVWDFFGHEGIFVEMAGRTGGAVLPFDASALPQLKELLAAVAVLAVGGVEALEVKQATAPAARLLLEHLGSTKALR